MSATLTWANSGLGTKTGTAAANFFDDLDTLITSKSGDATFFWQTAGKSSVSTPFWILLSRKDGSAGRILIVCWTTGPAANNAAILDTSPTTSGIYIAWFPSGTANTASNLTAASGTICGVDTNCVKVCHMGSLTLEYAASFQHFYADSAEGMVFGTSIPAGGVTYFCGAGDLMIDASDVVYGCTFGGAGNSASSFGGTTSLFPWSGSAILAGSSTTAHMRTNYGATNRLQFAAWSPSGTWASQAVGTADILTDNSVGNVWFVPTQLLGQTKGEGFKLKLRQIAYGPGTTGPFSVYNTTGPVVAARQFCALTAGGNGFPWMVNFKV